MKSRNYTVNEVIRSLSKKGCVITLDKPITKQEVRAKLPNRDYVTKKYETFLLGNAEEFGTLALVLGEENAALISWNNFQEKFPKLFQPQEYTETITVQAPYVINIQKGNDLGNGSWGKIDFMVKYQGFSVMK